MTDFYGDDFDRHCLSAQLTSLASQFEAETEPQRVRQQLSLHDIITYLKSLSSAERAIFSEVVKLLEIVLVNPNSD